MTTSETSPVPPFERGLYQQVADCYEELVHDVRPREADVAVDLPPGIEVDPLHESLQFPIRLWERGQKSSRTVPALVAYADYEDNDEMDAVRRTLVGLDVLVSMLDEFIDVTRPSETVRAALATNVAFSSLYAFTSIPADEREAVAEELTRYLVEASRIPAVERQVQRQLRATESLEEAVELIAFAYEFRARDVSAFARIPALVFDVTEPERDRIARDLRTYRAHDILFDDVTDVDEDRANGLGSPVTWLLQQYDDPNAVAALLEDVYSRFEYSGADYADRLSRMEGRPNDFRQTLAASMPPHARE